MWRAAFLPWPVAIVTERSLGHHVAAGEDARPAGHHVGTDDHRAVGLMDDLGDRAQEPAVGVLADGEDDGVGLQRFDLAGRLRPPVFVDPHPLDREIAAVDRLDRGQPLDLDAFRQRLVGLELVGGHVRPVAAIDDHRVVGAEPARGARGVHRGVAAAVDHDAAAEQRRLARSRCRAASTPRRAP